MCHCFAIDVALAGPQISHASIIVNAGGSRPDSAPARTATAPPALTSQADAKPGSGGAIAIEADASGVRDVL